MAYLPTSEKKREEESTLQGVDRPSSSVAPSAPTGGPAPASVTPPPQAQTATPWGGVRAFLGANRGGMDRVQEGQANDLIARGSGLLERDAAARNVTLDLAGKPAEMGRGGWARDTADKAWQDYAASTKDERASFGTAAGSLASGAGLNRYDQALMDPTAAWRSTLSWMAGAARDGSSATPEITLTDSSRTQTRGGSAPSVGRAPTWGGRGAVLPDPDRYANNSDPYAHHNWATAGKAHVPRAAPGAAPPGMVWDKRANGWRGGWVPESGPQPDSNDPLSGA